MIVPVIIGFIYIFLFEFVLHGILLKNQYEATAGLWRSPQEMNFPLLMGFQFLSSAILFCIYKHGYEKSPQGGLQFGVKLGIFSGLVMSSSYVMTPIPALLAMEWFGGELLKVIGLGIVWGVLAAKFCKNGVCSTEGGKGCC
ncbi:MAG: hypothetical protein IT558_03825 [Alphaproteobacteria bacterium]|nr:hypothetical protein [Alphaproteobacteria bacterium]